MNSRRKVGIVARSVRDGFSARRHRAASRVGIVTSGHRRRWPIRLGIEQTNPFNVHAAGAKCIFASVRRTAVASLPTADRGRPVAHAHQPYATPTMRKIPNILHATDFSLLGDFYK